MQRGLLHVRIRYAKSLLDPHLNQQEMDVLEEACMEMASAKLVAAKRPIGKVTISLIRAQGLPKMDIFGTCDPFLTVDYEGKQVRLIRFLFDFIRISSI